MTLGPGKYDHTCTQVREQTRADGVLMIVINGFLGSGFSCQATVEITANIPQLLRMTADEIERSGVHA